MSLFCKKKLFGDPDLPLLMLHVLVSVGVLWAIVGFIVQCVESQSFLILPFVNILLICSFASLLYRFPSRAHSPWVLCICALSIFTIAIADGHGLGFALGFNLLFSYYEKLTQHETWTLFGLQWGVFTGFSLSRMIHDHEESHYYAYASEIAMYTGALALISHVQSNTQRAPQPPPAAAPSPENPTSLWLMKEYTATSRRQSIRKDPSLSSLFSRSNSMNLPPTNLPPVQEPNSLLDAPSMGDGESLQKRLARLTWPSYKDTGLLDRIDDWNFPIFELNELSQGHALLFIGERIFQSRQFLTSYNISIQTLRNFLLVVESLYNDHPYHNALHAADVTQTFHYLLRQIFPKAQHEFLCFCALVAAIVHDIDHSGVSNSFLTKTHAPRSLRFNDQSPQEHHHLITAFQILNMPHEECNLFQHLNPEMSAQARKILIELILSTDMGRHFNLLEQFTKQSTHINFAAQEDVLDLFVILLKCADLSHATKCTSLHQAWTERITNEFYLQGDCERAMGMTVSTFMDRQAPEFKTSQLSFLDIIVSPLFKTLHVWAKETLDIELPCIASLEQNRKLYES